MPEVVTAHLSVREENGREVRILVDNTDKGSAPWEGDLAPGLHTVEAKGDRFAAEKRSVTLAKAQRLDLVFTAEPTTGRLRIVASPRGATIEVNHRAVGSGSWEGEVAPGPHQILVTAGTSRAVRDVVVERGALVVQEVPLSEIPLIEMLRAEQERADERDRSEARRRLRVVVSLESGVGIWNMPTGNIPAQVPVRDPSDKALGEFGWLAGGALSVRYQLADVWALQARLNGQTLIVGLPTRSGQDAPIPPPRSVERRCTSVWT